MIGEIVFCHKSFFLHMLHSFLQYLIVEFIMKLEIIVLALYDRLISLLKLSYTLI